MNGGGFGGDVSHTDDAHSGGGNMPEEELENDRDPGRDHGPLMKLPLLGTEVYGNRGPGAPTRLPHYARIHNLTLPTRRCWPQRALAFGRPPCNSLRALP